MRLKTVEGAEVRATPVADGAGVFVGITSARPGAFGTGYGLLAPAEQRLLIDALEPTAAPRAEPAPPAPALVGTEWLTGPAQAPRRWRVEYRGYGPNAVWRPSHLTGVMGRTFESSDAALNAPRTATGTMIADHKLHYRAVPAC